MVHFADWIPDRRNQIAYSTVEPRSTPPGWQANNDLILVNINEFGYPVSKEVLIDTNSGGIYGWWGTTYTWSNSGNMIIYARPDSIGQVNLDSKEMVPLVNYYQSKLVAIGLGFLESASAAMTLLYL